MYDLEYVFGEGYDDVGIPLQVLYPVKQHVSPESNYANIHGL